MSRDRAISTEVSLVVARCVVVTSVSRVGTGVLL